jgi:hypothetical protein
MPAATPPRVLVIINPAAGQTDAERILKVIESALTAAGADFKIEQTRGEGDALEWAKSASGYDRVLVAGGDGAGVQHGPVVGDDEAGPGAAGRRRAVGRPVGGDLAAADVEVAEIGAGGLSGAPLTARSLEVLRALRRRVGEDLTLIGVGGISAVCGPSSGATLSSTERYWCVFRVMNTTS